MLVSGRAKVEIVQFLFDHTVPQTLQVLRSPPKSQVRGRCLRQKSQRLWISHQKPLQSTAGGEGKLMDERLGGGFKYFLFSLYLGKIPNLTNISNGLKPPTRRCLFFGNIIPKILVKHVEPVVFFFGGGPSDVLCEMFFYKHVEV